MTSSATYLRTPTPASSHSGSLGACTTATLGWCASGRETTTRSQGGGPAKTLFASSVAPRIYTVMYIKTRSISWIRQGFGQFSLEEKLAAALLRLLALAVE